MLQAPDVIRESLDDLLNTLDAGENPPIDSNAKPNRRLRLRRSFRTPCEVTCFPAGQPMTIIEGVTRNVSFQGLSVVIESPLVTGQPVEVVIELPDHGATHLAGIITFSRRVPGQRHEIGMVVKASAAEPIFRADPTTAADRHPWLKAALGGVASLSD
ncbi:MAG: PilZ domain-containing protein [Planctomycetes bacterium]|nr:PilZ domain-containing protein [Planctomycetota bacterium]